MKHWYAVHCQPQGEWKALANLGRQGFEAFLPRFRKCIRHARQVRQVLAPLFPRYLFVRLDLEAERWLAVNGTFGVVGLVACAGRPLPVPEPVMAGISARCDENGIVELAPPAFRAGQPLRIADGPLADAVGLFCSLDERQRVTLLLDLLGRPVRVAVPVRSVAAA